MIWTAYTTVAAVIQLENRFLLVEEMSADGKLVLNQPAGHLDEGESLLQAVVRETREETAWGFIPRGLVGIYRWQVPPNGKTYMRFCFFGECHDHREQQALDPDILRIRWLTRQHLEEHKTSLRSPMVLQCIDDYLEGSRYSLDILHNLV